MCCYSWGCKELEMTEKLNRSELNFPDGAEDKASACNGGDLGSIPGLGRSPGEGNGNPLQYSCLKNPLDRGAWWATLHGVAKSQTRLSDFISNYGGGDEDNGDLLQRSHVTLLHSVPLTLQQATTDPRLCQRLLDTQVQVWVSLLCAHCSFFPRLDLIDRVPETMDGGS